MNNTLMAEILGSMAEAVITVDKDQRITLFNMGAERIFGYREDEVLGQSLEILIPEIFRSNHKEQVAHFATTLQKSRFMTDRGEIAGQRKNGEVFPAEASISKIKVNGGNLFTAVLRDITERKEAEDRLHGSYVEAITSLVHAAENRDDDTGEHIKRISYYSKELAIHVGMDQEFCNMIFHASAMHDIGKIGIPDSILLKPGALSPEEWEIMKSHTIIGSNILEGAFSPYLNMGREIALGHHERWDGSGYPSGAKGEEIPLTARIMQLADVYDALRNVRPYKPPFDHAKAVAIICNGDGRTEPSHFDPKVLSAFVSHSDRFNEIFEELTTH
jgi:PAS domain S-box-containing protein